MIHEARCQRGQARAAGHPMRCRAPPGRRPGGDGDRSGREQKAAHAGLARAHAAAEAAARQLLPAVR